MYTATIRVDADPDVIEKCFRSEDKAFAERSIYDVQKDKKGVTFTVTAQDATALRAHLNTIAKMLLIIEGMKDIT